MSDGDAYKEWAKQVDCAEWNTFTCAAGAAGGPQHLQYSRDNACPWTARTCTKAALGGHLDLLI